ncbi:hypothetical protein QUS97_22800, partial [Xanthomonas citri pv. citri]
MVHLGSHRRSRAAGPSAGSIEAFHKGTDMGWRYVVSAFILCGHFHIADGCCPRLHVVGNLWRDPTQTLDEGWRIRQIAAVHIEHYL